MEVIVIECENRRKLIKHENPTFVPRKNENVIIDNKVYDVINTCTDYDTKQIIVIVKEMDSLWK